MTPKTRIAAHPLHRTYAPTLVTAVRQRLWELGIPAHTASQSLLSNHGSYLSVLATTVDRGRSTTVGTALRLMRSVGLMIVADDGHAIRTPIEFCVRLRAHMRGAGRTPQDLANRLCADPRTIRKLLADPTNSNLERALDAMIALGVQLDIVKDDAWPGL
ncbi:hypothetical protein [Deinococcus peraridilitoris]|uniref:Uncharacterized protein n=1 Tax=Deinococcus peraridilitoris (strain DSM 19664 / LMG 22246 / CIP 109416 / KR-200) TaxID=937777 RepID=L0A1Y9_DEIPD|nr:hypothetical protein [Deinococcus peraridilitoris]AFZ67172.1 hypothetical protein Deipe_1637 [Deinococcus peraridilitoris DSM 19664]